MMLNLRIIIAAGIIALCLLPISYSIENLPLHKMEARYSLSPNESIGNFLNLTFSQAVSGNISFYLGSNATVSSISDGNNSLAYNLTNATLIIPLHENASLLRLVMDYTTKGEIFQKDSVSLFIKEFHFRAPINKILISVDFPPGIAIYNSEFNPKAAKITSDGEKISLVWDERSSVKDLTYSVRFTSRENLQVPEKENEEKESINPFHISQILFILPGIAALVVILAIFISIRQKQKIRQILLTGFMEDEKKAILYLEKNRAVWQNKMRKDLGFSRAKSTRIVKKLESQGLLKKDSFGKTNKIIWLK